jgi:hypothetical protein
MNNNNSVEQNSWEASSRSASPNVLPLCNPNRRGPSLVLEHSML